MGHPPRAFLWVSIALVVAVLAGGAMPRGRRSPLDAPGLIGYLYVNEGTADRNDPEADNVVAGFAAFADGALALLPSSPWSTGGKGTSGPVFLAAPRIVIGPDARHLFVANWGSHSLAVFDIADDGSLGAIEGSPFDSRGLHPEGLALSPDGRFLFVGHSGDHSIVSFVLDGGGRPVPASSFAIDTEPDGLATTPDGRFLLASLPSLGRIAVLRVAADGGLSHVPGSPFDADAGAADGIVLGRGGALAYVADARTSRTELSLYSLDPRGVLRSVPGSPFRTPGPAANILHLPPGAAVLRHAAGHRPRRRLRHRRRRATVARSGLAVQGRSARHGADRNGERSARSLPVRRRRYERRDLRAASGFPGPSAAGGGRRAHRRSRPAALRSGVRGRGGRGR